MCRAAGTIAERGNTMLVKAKWNVKDTSGWHISGDVFQTEDDLGDAVECLEKPAVKEQPKPVKEAPKAEPKAEAEAEVKAEAEPEKPKTTRRKKVSE